MANTKPIGVAFADPVLESGTEISEAAKAENDLFSDFVSQHQGGTIATTGNSDTFIIAPYSGVVSGAIFSGVDALAANNTNYITFSITNLGQAGAGSAASLVVVKGDRLRLRAAATGTLANTVVAPVYALTFTPA